MTVPPEDPPSPSPELERSYVQALAGLERGRELDIEALCAAHPEHATGLRELHERWQRLRGEIRGQRPSATLAERLKQRYGPEADPNVSLQGKAEPASDFSSEVLARLSGRKGSFTRYKLEGEVARGGMGAVLRVWDEDLRRHLAMKVVLGKGEARSKGATPDVPPASLARFLEEAQVTGQLDHPGIVPVHELGLDADGRVYFTMKLVKGKNLKEVFDELSRGEGGWTQTRVLGLILKVCEAMAYAHDKGVIHRDLKPANVMVGKFGEVYVMDWGLAKILGREDHKDLRVREEMPRTTTELRSDRKDRATETPDSPLVTMDGDVVGTPAYMSPEQAMGRVAEMGPPSDVYAVGAMLYQLLAGHMPYVPPGARLNNYAVWQRVQEGPPRSLHELAPRVPVELVAICEKAMTRDAKARYSDMAALAEDLSAFIEGRVVRAYQTSFLRKVRTLWKRQSGLSKTGIVVGYGFFPLLILAALILDSMIASLINPLLIVSSLLIGAGLLSRRQARLSSTLALAPLLALLLLINTPIARIVYRILRPPPSPSAHDLAYDRWRSEVTVAELDGDPETIVSVIRSASLNDRSIGDQILLARSLRLLGRREEAVACLEEYIDHAEYIDLPPELRWIQFDRSWQTMQTLRVILFLELGRTSQALDALLDGFDK